MSDIIREVDEELRRERLARIWQDYGVYIVAAAVALVLAVAGFRAWQWYDARESARVGVRLEEALKLVADNKPREAEEAFAAIVRDAPSGYRVLARFGVAAEIGRRDPKAGAAAFDAIAADAPDAASRDLARLRAGMLLVDVAPAAEIATRLAPLMKDSPFRHGAREIVALSRYKAGEVEAARRLVFEIMLDPETPAQERNRAQLLLALLGGDTKPAAPATQ
jgi:hypothetical protein